MSLWVILQAENLPNPSIYRVFAAFKLAVEAIEAAGFTIKGIIIDGKQALFKEFEKYPVQMCQFHMYQIVERYLIKHPKMIASRDLALLVDDMIYLDKEDFMNEYVK